MELYNSLTRDVETFVLHREDVTIYVCGITPYDTTHLGHAFTYTAFDILIRYLEFAGYVVKYVQNVTDIDDDILREAREEGVNWREWGNQWTLHFIEDMKELNVRPPDRFPRATSVIPEMIEVVQGLIEAGVAYESGGSVYFGIDKYPDYGKLSRIPRDEMLPIANERGNDPTDPHKKDPLDFVLWQAQASDEPAWDSPWSLGRPGWHIECSTMATEYLGEVIDIHGGGADLIFPHHESEIAQTVCYTNRETFTRFWMHTAMVRHEGEKMSKSLGNLVMARDLLRDYSADALRLYLGSYHYREAWAHDPRRLQWASHLSYRLKGAVSARGDSGGPLQVERFRHQFIEAMESDLDTPAAIEVLDEMSTAVLGGAEEGAQITGAQELLRDLSSVFGLRLDADEPEARVREGWDQHAEQGGFDV